MDRSVGSTGGDEHRRQGGPTYTSSRGRGRRLFGVELAGRRNRPVLLLQVAEWSASSPRGPLTSGALSLVEGHQYPRPGGWANHAARLAGAPMGLWHRREWLKVPAHSKTANESLQ